MAIHPQVRVVVRPFGSVAAVIAFLSRDTMAGVAPGLFAGSWFLTGFAVGLLASVAWLGQPLIALLLTVSLARAVCSAVYELGGGVGWNHLGGWIALAIYCVAMYGGLIPAGGREGPCGASAEASWREPGGDRGRPGGAAVRPRERAGCAKAPVGESFGHAPSRATLAEAGPASRAAGARSRAAAPGAGSDAAAPGSRVAADDLGLREGHSG
jgi:hypothetical protein